jgi:hypothetical protein
MAKKNRKRVLPERIEKAFTKKAAFNCWKLSVALFIFVWLYEFANQVVFTNFDSAHPIVSINWNSVLFQKVSFLIIMSLIFASFMWILALVPPDAMGAVFRMLGFEKEEKSEKEVTDKLDNTESEKTKRLNDREFQLDLMKIQIYADRCHTILSSALSFVFVFFSLIVIFYAVLYQSGNFESIPAFIKAFQTWLVGTFFISAFTLIFLTIVLWRYSGTYEEISKMLEQVRKGKELPELIKMPLKKKQ